MKKKNQYETIISMTIDEREKFADLVENNHNIRYF